MTILTNTTKLNCLKYSYLWSCNFSDTKVIFEISRKIKTIVHQDEKQNNTIIELQNQTKKLEKKSKYVQILIYQPKEKY